MLLLKLFVKDYQNTESSVVRGKYGVLSGFFGIVINLTLSISKFIVGGLTNSVAITADAFNNLTDCLTSLLTIIGFKISAKPADKTHPFGHSRVEYIVSLAVSVIIFITGWEVLTSSIDRIITPEPTYFSYVAIIVLIIGMLAKLWKWTFNRNLGNAIKSDTLLAVGVDSRNDVLIQAVTLLPMLLSLVTDVMIDGYIGVMMAFVFLRSGYGVSKDALEKIMGTAIDHTVAQNIKKMVKNNEGILGVHDLIVHNYGPNRYMASIHVEVSKDVPIEKSHAIIVAIADEVLETLGISLVIQMDPIDLSDDRLQRISLLTQNLLQEKYPDLHPHEFRIINSQPLPILVFELEVPHQEQKKVDALKTTIITDLKQVSPQYDYEIDIEYSYVNLG